MRDTQGSDGSGEISHIDFDVSQYSQSLSSSKLTSYNNSGKNLSNKISSEGKYKNSNKSDPLKESQLLGNGEND